MSTIYFNTKTNATQTFTDKELSSMKPEFRKRWREASDSEIKLHEKRQEQNDVLKNAEKTRVKKKQAADKAKAEKLSNIIADKANAESDASDKRQKGESDKPKADAPK